MRASVIGLLALWLGSAVATAQTEQSGRFIEFKTSNQTTTFDLNTVQMIQPGRLTIIQTSIDDPDVMKLKLGALDAMRNYCERPDGKYPLPPKLLTLGPPDMPMLDIEVKTNNPYKSILWFYPYTRLAIGAEEGGDILHCWNATEYNEARNAILSGVRQKYLYDCKRGLLGLFMDVADDPEKAIMGFVPKGSYADEYYQTVCRAVIHEEPYIPK